MKPFFCFLILFCSYSNNASDIVFYVDPYISIEENRMFNSVQNAIDSSIKYKSNKVSIVVSNIKITKPIIIDSRHSRNDNFPLIIEAENGAYIDGSVKLSSSTRVVNEIIDGSFSNVFKFKLPNSISYEKNNFRKFPIFTFNNSLINVSRYPHDSFLTINEYNLNENAHILSVINSDVHDFSKEIDLWAHGFWFWDWRDEHHKVNFKNNNFEIQGAAHEYGYRKGQYFYLKNIYQNLTYSQSWFLDTNQNEVYFSFKPNGEITKEINVSYSNGLINISDAKNIIIKNFILKNSLSDGVTVKNSSYIVLDNLEVKNIVGVGIVLSGGENNLLKNSDIFNIGRSAIVISGGSRSILKPSNHCVVNSSIHNYGTTGYTFQPGVVLNGVGNCVVSNNIFNSPNPAVVFRGNDHVIQNNNIFSVLKYSNDAGAIYSGRDWSTLGVNISYNRITSICGYNSDGAKGIYLDDEVSGASIIGNIIHDVKDAIFIGGGRLNVVHGNDISSSKRPFYIDSRGLSWATHNFKSLTRFFDNAKFDKKVWTQKYPFMSSMEITPKRAPVGTVVTNNVFDTPKWNYTTILSVEHVDFSGNQVIIPQSKYQVSQNTKITPCIKKKLTLL